MLKGILCFKILMEIKKNKKEDVGSYNLAKRKLMESYFEKNMGTNREIKRRRNLWGGDRDE